MNLTETCPCGAKFDVTDVPESGVPDVTELVNGWRQAHCSCRETVTRPPTPLQQACYATPPTPPTAHPSRSTPSVTDVILDYRAISKPTEQLRERAAADPTPENKAAVFRRVAFEELVDKPLAGIPLRSETKARPSLHNVPRPAEDHRNHVHVALDPPPRGAHGEWVVAAAGRLGWLGRLRRVRDVIERIAVEADRHEQELFRVRAQRDTVQARYDELRAEHDDCLGGVHVPRCDRCGAIQVQPGAILLGPPTDDGMARKWHLCVRCYGDHGPDWPLDGEWDEAAAADMTSAMAEMGVQVPPARPTVARRPASTAKAGHPHHPLYLPKSATREHHAPLD